MPLLGAEDLRRTLARIDGRGYKAYQDLRGDYRLGAWTLTIAHVQADPYAPPSRVQIRADLRETGLAAFAGGPAPRLRALEDFLARRLASEIDHRAAREPSDTRDQPVREGAIELAAGRGDGLHRGLVARTHAGERRTSERREQLAARRAAVDVALQRRRVVLVQLAAEEGDEQRGVRTPAADFGVHDDIHGRASRV